MKKLEKLWILLKILPIIIIGWYFIYIILWRILISGKTPVDDKWPTNDVTVVTWMDIIQLTWINNTWIVINSNYWINDVYNILEKWEGGKDYSIINLNKQNTHNGTQTELIKFLSTNIFSVKMPEDIVWWYLYIVLNKPLKYMSTLSMYQPVTLKTNIYENNWWIYWRLDTDKTLDVKITTKEFLYDLKKIPIKTAWSNASNRLSMKWENIQIWGFISDTEWNYIEKIVFIWKY